MMAWIRAISVCVAMALSAAVSANPDNGNGKLISAALTAVEDGDMEAAARLGAQISDPIGADLVTWERLRNEDGKWSDYRAFLAKDLNWPGLKRLRRKGEAVIPENANPKRVLAYFKTQLPQTGIGSLRLASAYWSMGQQSNARKEAIRAWTTLSLKNDEEAELYRKYKSVLKGQNLTRLDNLLWRGLAGEADRMLGKVPDANAKLARARIGLQRVSKNIDGLISAVPENLQSDPGLAYDRFQWRIKKGRWDDAQDLLARQTGSVEKLGRPEAWSKRRRGFARRAMRAGDTKLAYRIASRHELSEGADFADLEWLSGYIALTKLNNPQKALAHFVNFQGAVKSPVSLGRAGYWLGRTYENLGQYEKSSKAYGQGAKYQTSFYGQLAAEKLGLAPDASLSGKTAVPDWRKAGFLQTPTVQAGLLLNHADDAARMRWFFTHAARKLDKTGLSQLADLALYVDRPSVALAVAKVAALRGIILPEPYFPVTGLARYSTAVPPEVAMSIARRESELNPEAQSPAGARGLMQLMPGTAKKVSKEIGITYSKARLTSDWKYNAKLGTSYLGGLLEKFNGSYILAFAGYNAGPNRAEKWITEYGDPRMDAVDQIEWIENIPYRETRNYVMRVIESLHVYRARLNGKTPPIRLTRDLKRG
jgi:peptidoglycan lytic transglycosylase